MPKELPPNQNPFFVILGLVTTVIFIKIIPVIIVRLTNRVRSEHRIQYNVLNGLRTELQNIREALNTTNLRSNNILSNRLQNPGFDLLTPSVTNVADWNYATDNYGRLLTIVESQWNNINNLLEFLRNGGMLDIATLNTTINETQEILQSLEPAIDNLRRDVDRLIQPLLISAPVVKTKGPYRK
jgi:hypothetical protein